VSFRFVCSRGYSADRSFESSIALSAVASRRRVNDRVRVDPLFEIGSLLPCLGEVAIEALF
jgi:hypothetical protein